MTASFFLFASPASASRDRCQPVNKAINESISRFDPFRSKEPGFNWKRFNKDPGCQKSELIIFRVARTKAVRAGRAVQCTMVICTATAVQREASLLSYLSVHPRLCRLPLSIVQSICQNQNQNQNLSCLNVPESPRCRVCDDARLACAASLIPTPSSSRIQERVLSTRDPEIQRFRNWRNCTF